MLPLDKLLDFEPGALKELNSLYKIPSKRVNLLSIPFADLSYDVDDIEALGRLEEIVEESDYNARREGFETLEIVVEKAILKIKSLKSTLNVFGITDITDVNNVQAKLVLFNNYLSSVKSTVCSESFDASGFDMEEIQFESQPINENFLRD